MTNKLFDMHVMESCDWLLQRCYNDCAHVARMWQQSTVWADHLRVKAAAPLFGRLHKALALACTNLHGLHAATVLCVA
jgi:hypothetical protein